MIRIRMGAEELIELGRSRCGKGEIVRSGFRKSNGTYVKPTCVPDSGSPGKTPISKRVLPVPKTGSLGVWKKEMPVSRRHEELKKTVARRGCRQVIGSLTLLRNLSADPGTKTAAKADAKWVHKQGFCKLKGKA